MHNVILNCLECDAPLIHVAEDGETVLQCSDNHCGVRYHLDDFYTEAFDVN